MTKRRRKQRAGTALALVALVLSSACGGDDAGPSAAPARIAMIPKGTTHVFWKTVERGARAAAEEAGVELVWKGPLQENDRAEEIRLVQQLASSGIAGLALAPLDHAALVPAVRDARALGLPVVIFDSDLDGEPGRDFESFVATDNRAAGRLAGERMTRVLPEGGRLVLLRYQVGSASTAAREEGFLEVVRAAGFEVLVDNRYAGATAGEAKTEALNLLDRLREADGIFCSNESATYGMLLALRQADLVGRAKLVGFDASPPLVEALDAGEVDALVVQDPRRMGELSVKTLLACIEGRPVERRIDTGAVLVTPENRREPAVAALLE